MSDSFDDIDSNNDVKEMEESDEDSNSKDEDGVGDVQMSIWPCRFPPYVVFYYESYFLEC